MICYVLAMGKQHLGPHVVLGYGIKFFWPGLFITSPDHLVDNGHPSYQQLTPVKTRFPLTSDHTTISWAQVYSSSRSRVFVKLTANQVLDWIAGSCQVNL